MFLAHASKPRYFKYSATNSAWWKDKLLNNKIRDSRKINVLEKLGWRKSVVWGCEIKNKSIFNDEILYKINIDYSKRGFT